MLNKTTLSLTIFRIIAFFIAINIFLSSFSSYFLTVYAAPQTPPFPFTLVNPTEKFNQVCLSGIEIYPNEPFKFSFMLNEGDTNYADTQLKEETNKLIKYFLAALTIPDKDLWVNLSPNEPDRIISQELGLTDMGKDLLSQDYILKQLTASLTYPESPLGKTYWNKIYKRAYELFGTTKIPVNTFNKIWIVPEKAVIYEDGVKAYVGEARLKVMIEDDYFAISANSREFAKETLINANKIRENSRSDDSRKLASKIMKEVIVPIIEEEVNYGKNFAKLRQIYYSLILATWFKQKLRKTIFVETSNQSTEARGQMTENTRDEGEKQEKSINNNSRKFAKNKLAGISVLNNLYIDKKKIKGVDSNDPKIKEKIYNQYLEAYKKGVYDYIRQDFEANLGKQITRRYYSGGVDGAALVNVVSVVPIANLSPDRQIMVNSLIGKRTQDSLTIELTSASEQAKGDYENTSVSMEGVHSYSSASNFRETAASSSIPFIHELDSYKDKLMNLRSLSVGEQQKLLTDMSKLEFKYLENGLPWLPKDLLFSLEFEMGLIGPSGKIYVTDELVSDFKDVLRNIIGDTEDQVTKFVKEYLEVRVSFLANEQASWVKLEKAILAINGLMKKYPKLVYISILIYTRI